MIRIDLPYSMCPFWAQIDSFEDSHDHHGGPRTPILGGADKQAGALTPPNNWAHQRTDHYVADLWGEYLENQPGDALEKIERQRQLWLEGAEKVPPFPGADPDQLQLLSDENRKALDDLSKRLVVHFHQARASKSKKRKTAHPPSRPRFPGKKA